VRVWAFNEQKLKGEIALFSAPVKGNGRGKDPFKKIVVAKGHAPSGLVAVACGDATTRVVDVAGLRRVRTLRCGGSSSDEGASGDHSVLQKTVATCLEFSSDGRWVLASSADGCVRVWDVPAARLLQTVRFGGFDKGNVVTGMSLSPAMDMLATTHEGRRGVYLWANAAVYAPSATGSANPSEAEADENTPPTRTPRPVTVRRR
jgi:U3 small nucleolar RNA-associated protein 21